MKIDFLPEEKAAEQRLSELVKVVVKKIKDPFNINTGQIVNFDLQNEIWSRYNVPFSEIPEFSFDPKAMSVSCPTGQYIFLIRKIKNNLK